MKLLISKRFLALLAIPLFALSVASVAVVPAGAAAPLTLSGGASSAQGTDQASCLFGSEAGCEGKTPLFRTITNVMLFVIGAISVIMLVVGGIRYTTSAGDSAAVTGAKNTIMYAIVGIVVALLAFAVVNFVIGAFVPATA